MNYALIEDGIVTNIIWIYPANVSDFPNAVNIDMYPVAIGDTYDGEFFYREGEKILSYDELKDSQMQDMQEALNLLGVEAQ